MRRAGSAAYWLVPSAICLALYWSGVWVWFQQDDFAWLSLEQKVHGWRDLAWALFAPMAQGTVRTWSERVFFLASTSLFGLDPLPLRLWAIGTQLANLVLLSAVVLRVSGSRLAGFSAPLFWTLNAVMVAPMCWSSAYNQILCSFFLLLGLYFWIRYIETEQHKYLMLQWAAFLLGFGALEVNIVYPALAACYALIRAPKHLRKVWPMFAVSAAYLALHFALAPLATGAYALHFDAGIVRTLWNYWELALGIGRTGTIVLVPAWFGPLGTALLSIAVLGFALFCAIRRNWLPLFFLAWFLIVLLPVLPLRDHVSEYYLASPVAGLSAFMAMGLAAAWHRSGTFGLVASVLALIFVAGNWPIIHIESRWWLDRGTKVQSLVLGVAAVSQVNPDKTILLTGVSDTLFWGAMVDNPFRVFGAQRVYLAPGADAAIEKHPEVNDVSKFAMAHAVALQELHGNRAVVYEAGKSTLRNVTRNFVARLAGESTGKAPRYVNIGSIDSTNLLGPEWHPLEENFRWMPKRATLTLGGPNSASDRLYLSVLCPKENLIQGRMSVFVTADGHSLGSTPVEVAGSGIEISFPLPRILLGKEKITLAIEAERTFRNPGDSRDLSLAVRSVAIR